MAITESDFLTNLKNGKYAALGGARKALAKAHLSSAVKASLHAAAEKHFDGAVVKAAPSPKLKKDGSPKAKPGRKPGVSVKPATHKAVIKGAATAVRTHAIRPAISVLSSSPADTTDTQLGLVAQAINALETAHRLSPEFDIATAAAQAGRIVTHLLEKISGELGMTVEVHAGTEGPANDLGAEPATSDDTVARILGTSANGLGAHA